MADLLDFTPVRILTADAAPGAAYTVAFYLSGTTTPATVYQDAGLSIPFSSTISADGNGDFPAIYNGGTALKAVIQDALGGTVATVDPVRRSSLTATGAAGVSFAPTIALPFTNVQAAIEGSVAAAASGYQTYGLAVTGSATLLANIDATNIASGAYRFDATTTGTFPTQSAAANTGIIETWRETSGSAVMFLYDDTLNVFWFRRMASSAWGAWREVIMSDQGSAQGDILYRGASNWTRLAKGTAAQVLTMNGGATAPAWATPAAMSSITLLGTITTTSGASQTLSGLDLTSYKSIRLVFKAVSPNAAANFYIDTTASVVCVASNANNIFRGLVDLDLEDGTYSANLALVASSGLMSAASQPYAGKTGITTASTSIVIGVSAGAFDAGSVLVYGVK